MLEPSDTVMQCPYKGVASHCLARIGDQLYEDVPWSYPFPTAECCKIQGLLCFYPNRVDALCVDDEEK